MRETTRGHLLSIFCTVCCAGLLHVDARTQQTFVVRYKNGEHTVPVTVVLDYKKQTEYVINMSPRASTKTVTLYDFKQKTIAYKDLTNRECFLGYLTHETLNEETDALTKIHSPVERQPKMLSLDPHRSSLTPTEIRNMAGQKTAVFCGKMNTWLVLPVETHSILKREVDEIDERTFHRHGYHTVRYSHFGRETRRRYRKPASRHIFQGRTDTPDVADWKAQNSETLPANSVKPLEYKSFQQQLLNPLPLETALTGNNRVFHHTEHPVINGKEGFHIPPTFLPASNEADWNSKKNASSASQWNGFNNEYEGKFSFTTFQTPNYLDEADDKLNNEKGIQRNYFSNLQGTDVINGTFSKEKEFVSKNKLFLEMTENNHQNWENHTFDINRDHGQSEVEDESIPFGYDLNVNQRKLFPEHVALENPDVSSNVLEIPKATKKLENIDNSLQSPPITQTNEDVHDVFEGFFNLRKGNPPPEQLPYNSYFISSAANEERKHNHSDEDSINNYPFFSPSRINNDTDRKQQWEKNEIHISKISEVVASTDLPSLTTKVYSNYNRETIPPTYWNGFSDSKTLKRKSENWGNLNSTPQKVDHHSRSHTDELLQPIPSKSENILNKAVNEYFTTENPLFTISKKRYPDQRSGISDDIKLIKTTESFTSNNLNQNYKETSERQNLFHSDISKDISSQQIRFQNVLRNYKPDEIVIEVEKIPTQRPPENTLGFKGQVYSPNNNVPPNLSVNVKGPKSEQTSGDTWRGRPILKPNLSSMKTYNLQPEGLSFASRMPPQLRYNNSNLFQPRVVDNNIRQLINHNPQTLPQPFYNTQRSYKLDSLPPGVSIHPRHPKAPFADAIHSKVLPSVPQRRAPKHHHLRHHKKKDRLVNSCCRTKGKTKSCCGSCCQSKSLHSKPSCCSTSKPGKNELGQKQVLKVIAPALQQVRKPAEDPRNRCQKEKLCRTLYESTQQVMVCRHAKIEGC